MGKGLRTLSIESVNPDNFIITETRQTITHALRRNRIHVSAIAETHVPNSPNYVTDGYRVITTTASIRENPEQPQGLTTGGIFILVHAELEQHITQME